MQRQNFQLVPKRYDWIMYVLGVRAGGGEELHGTL